MPEAPAPSVVVLGSINVDLVFPVERLPREGETVAAEAVRALPGGKGANQALAAARAGARVALVGCTGDDAFAEVALGELRAGGVDLSRVARVPGPTGCAAIGVDRAGANLIMVSAGANRSALAAMVPDDLLHGSAVVVLQHEVPAGENLALARRACVSGARVLLNAAPARALAPDDWAGLLSVLVVNEAELDAFAASGSDHADRVRAAARRLGATVVVTLGSDGALAATPGGEGWRIGAPALERVVDTTGAGDCFTGALAASLAEGAGLPDALRFASAAAGLACTGEGAQGPLPRRPEIEAAAARLQPALPLPET